MCHVEDLVKESLNYRKIILEHLSLAKINDLEIPDWIETLRNLSTLECHNTWRIKILPTLGNPHNLERLVLNCMLQMQHLYKTSQPFEENRKQFSPRDKMYLTIDAIKKNSFRH